MSRCSTNLITSTIRNGHCEVAWTRSLPRFRYSGSSRGCYEIVAHQAVVIASSFQFHSRSINDQITLEILLVRLMKKFKTMCLMEK